MQFLTELLVLAIQMWPSKSSFSKCSAIFLLKKVLECKERSRIWLERGGVIPMPEKIQNAVPASVLLRKNFRNDILACSVTKISLAVARRNKSDMQL